MSRIDALLASFVRHLDLPWDPASPASPKVWMAVYDRTDERRLRARLDAFGDAVRARRLAWRALDVTTLVSNWLGAHEYAAAYFASPDLLEAEVADVERLALARLREALDEARADGARGVVALVGTGSLFGFASVSDLIKAVEGEVPGRLVVFFPGVYERGRYRLLDARDGWDYRALTITADP